VEIGPRADGEVAPDSDCSPSSSNRPGLDENEEGTLAPLKAIRRQPYVHLNGRVESYSASE
jgi:hypothetical protein